MAGILQIGGGSVKVYLETGPDDYKIGRLHTVTSECPEKFIVKVRGQVVAEVDPTNGWDVEVAWSEPSKSDTVAIRLADTVSESRRSQSRRSSNSRKTGRSRKTRKV